MHTVSFYRRQQNMVGVAVMSWNKGRLFIRNKMIVCAVDATYTMKTERMPYLKTMFVNDIASVTKICSGFWLNLLQESFTKSCQASVSLMKIGSVTYCTVLYLRTWTNFYPFVPYFFTELGEIWYRSLYNALNAQQRMYSSHTSPPLWHPATNASRPIPASPPPNRWTFQTDTCLSQHRSGHKPHMFVNEISSPHTYTYNRYTIPVTLYPNLKKANHGRNM